MNVELNKQLERMNCSVRYSHVAGGDVIAEVIDNSTSKAVATGRGVSEEAAQADAVANAAAIVATRPTQASYAALKAERDQLLVEVGTLRESVSRAHEDVTAIDTDRNAVRAQLEAAQAQAESAAELQAAGK